METLSKKEKVENKIINIATHGNQDIGYLSCLESNNNIPFEIKRIYYTYDVPVKIKRGMHAHKKLQQLLWCPYGEIEVILDDGKEKKVFILDTPDKGLLICKGFWREIYWKKDGSILCVAASDFYNEEDYIRDYDEYLQYVEKGYWNEK